MALINCPECSKDVSDRVKTCPHCGYPMDEHQTDSLSTTTQAQAADNPSSPKQKKPTRTISIIAVVLVVIAAIGFFVHQSQQKAAAEAAHDLYVDTLWLARSSILTSAVDAEELAVLTRDVWYNTIYEKDDVTTNKYTKSSYGYGFFNSDFNESLDSLTADPAVWTTRDRIKTSANSIKEIMRDLQNPTAEFEVCYATITELHDAYSALVSLAVSPSGSLTSYTEAYRKHDNALIAAYDKLDLQIPERYSPAVAD